MCHTRVAGSNRAYGAVHARVDTGPTRRAAGPVRRAQTAVHLHPEPAGVVRGLPPPLPLHLPRPAGTPKGPPWAHNSLGASVHTALRNWYALPEATAHRRRAADAAASATWVSEGYRDEEQEREMFRRALGWLEDYVAGLDPSTDPLGVERVVAARTDVLAFNGRADRIDPDGDRVGDRRLQDRPRRADRRRRARLAGAGALRVRGGAGVPAPCRRVELHHLPTGTVAAHEHTEESLARQLRRAEETAQDIDRRGAGGRRRAPIRTRRFRPRPARSAAGATSGKICPAGAGAPERRIRGRGSTARA